MGIGPYNWPPSLSSGCRVKQVVPLSSVGSPRDPPRSEPCDRGFPRQPRPGPGVHAFPGAGKLIITPPPLPALCPARNYAALGRPDDMLSGAARAPRRGLDACCVSQPLHHPGRRWRRLTTPDELGSLGGEASGLGDDPVSLIIGTEQGRQDGRVADADRMRRGEGRHDLGRQPRQLEVAAQPALAHLQAFGHLLLAAAVVALDGARIVAGRARSRTGRGGCGSRDRRAGRLPRR